MILSAVRPSTIQQPVNPYTIKAGATYIATLDHSWNGWNTAFATGWTNPGDTLTPLGFEMPGNSSYVWRDDKQGVRRFHLQGWPNQLFDLYFACNDSGSGTMFRLDGRGSGNPAGFATTSSWTQWNTPASGLYLNIERWYDITIDIGETEAIATVIGVITGIVGAGVTLVKNNVGIIRTAYTPLGTAWGLQGDGAGPASYIRHLTASS